MNHHPRRRRILGAVTGAALLLGGAFAAQAVADSGPKPAPKVVTPGEAAPKPAAPKPAPKPAVVKSAAPKPAVVKPAPSPAVGKPAPSPAPQHAVAKPVPAENAPRVIAPGTGAGK
ncbi:hypothetical protein ACWGQ4_30395 [Streptomyces sp. NPDC055721]|uniref:hypothetical protein n=1 Tax=Streptomyces sp. NPDC127132 TaxID=3345374 RepID=UPI00362C2543